jgi:hypothetical protein
MRKLVAAYRVGLYSERLAITARLPALAGEYSATVRTASVSQTRCGPRPGLLHSSFAASRRLEPVCGCVRMRLR